MSELWVKIVGQRYATPVPTQGCTSIAHFIKAVKNELQNALSNYDPNQISISLTEGGKPLPRRDKVSQLFSSEDFMNDDDNPLFISVEGFIH